MADGDVDPVSVLTSAFSDGNTSAPVGDTSNVEVTPPEPTTSTATPPSSTSTGHPAWQEVLNVIPESLHESVRPTLQKWDQGVEQRLSQVHSQYAPYKEFIDNQVETAQLQAGLQLYTALNQDPRGFYAYLQEFLGENVAPQQPNSGQGQNNNTVDLGEFGENNSNGEIDPRLAQQLSQLQAQQQQMQQFLAQQQQAAAEREATNWLSNEQSRITADVKQRRGVDMTKEDWNYVLGVAAAHNNMNPRGNPAESLTAAMKQFEAQLDRFTSRQTASSTAPPVFAPSGGTPSANFDPTKLSDQERRTLATQILTQRFRD